MGIEAIIKASSILILLYFNFEMFFFLLWLEREEVHNVLDDYYDPEDPSIVNEELKVYDPEDYSIIEANSSRSKASTTAGVNFTNVLCSAFTLVDPESLKKYI